MEAGSYRSDVQRRRLIAAGVVVGALIVGFLVWILFIRDDDSSPETGGTFEAKTVAGLRDAANEAGHDVYWAGPQGKATYELFTANDGRIYVRYLTGDGVIGDPRPKFLTVGTYPVPDALNALEQQAKQPGNKTRKVSGGGFVLAPTAARAHVYLAYPNSDFQIEVFDPKPGRALDLVTSGQIEPIG